MMESVCKISIDTVRFRISNTYERLHIGSKLEAAIKVIREQLTFFCADRRIVA
jgi:DNA-binding NarL/FixJ family response regulator